MIISFRSFFVCTRSLIKMSGFYYAVAKGRNPGIYHTWDECKAQVHQFAGPVFKKFKSEGEAREFINECPDFGFRKKSFSVSSNSFGRKRSHAQRFASSTRSDSEGLGYKKRRNDFADFKTSTQREKLDEDDGGFVNVWTDGACSKNGTKRARAGIGVWFGDRHSLNISRPVTERKTNNFAEIEAVTAAANAAEKAGVKKLRVHTDSEFLINSLSQWLPKWKRNGWKTATGQDVKNKIELQRLDGILQNFTKIEWNHVKGHAGNHGNEMADQLAREGAMKNH